MRLVLIPPYHNPDIKIDFLLHKLVQDYREKGLLEGIDIDIDEGNAIGSALNVRDEGFVAAVREGVIRKAGEYSGKGGYDAIVCTGGIDPGFMAARAASKIPFLGVIHSAVHIASLLGERFSFIHSTGFIRDTDSAIQIVKNIVGGYGFASRLASVRLVGGWVQYEYGFVQYVYEYLIKYRDNWAERLNDPELKKIVDDTISQCVAAVEKDGANSLIIPCEHMTAYADGVRRGLDEAGYSQTPLICGIPACLEVARAMVNWRRQRMWWS